MSDVIEQGQVNPQGQTQDPVATLPSDQPVEKTTEEIIKELETERDRYKKDHSELEKLMGRKAQESGDAKKQEEESKVQAEKQSAKDEYIKSVVDAVVQNGMNVEGEILNKLTELEIPVETVKLKAYEHKDKLDSVIKVFGSREAYDSALQYGAELGYSQERLAAEGLKALSQSRDPNAVVDTQTRISGSQIPTTPVRGYTSMAEYSADKRAAGNDVGMIKMLQEKAGRTDWKKIGVSI